MFTLRVKIYRRLFFNVHRRNRSQCELYSCYYCRNAYSPLMGPIMGIGLTIATNDFDLLKKGIKTLAIAVEISVTTSSIYFSVTSLYDASVELLARTYPSIWDVFIVLLDGLSGIAV